VADKSDSVSNEEKNLIAQGIPTDKKYSVGVYLDLNLWKQVGSGAASRVSDVPNGKVKVGITVPVNLQKAGRTYKIVRIHNGVTTVLDVVLDSATFRITFETDGFSTYALIYSDDTEAGGTGGGGSAGEPETDGSDDSGDDDSYVCDDDDSSNKLVASNNTGSSVTNSSTAANSKDVASNGGETKTNATAPKTGDSNSLTAWILLLLASLTGMTALIVSKKKETM
jgi:LPXTG-motif cell wall-anchored protein